MIATTESTNASFKALGVFQFTVTTQFLEPIKGKGSTFVDISAARHFGSNNLIYGSQIEVNVAKLHSQHTTANIHAHDIRNDLFSEVCGEADHTASTGVNIGHNTNLTVCKGRLLDKGVHLIESFRLNVFCKDFQIAHFAYSFLED